MLRYDASVYCMLLCLSFQLLSEVDVVYVYLYVSVECVCVHVYFLYFFRITTQLQYIEDSEPVVDGSRDRWCAVQWATKTN